MSLFSKILGKLGFNTASAEPTATPTPGTTPASTSVSTSAPGAAPTAAPAPPPAGPAPMSAVDVVAKLEGMAAGRPDKLNWKTSIVDLLKLLGLDSNLAARQELAAELGCPPETMQDSAQMNMWLHKTVMRKLAENGGNIPQELLH